MKNMVGIYFSGTGNTKYCVKKLANLLDKSAATFSLEDEEAIEAIITSETIIFGYPVYYSNLPKIVRDFITDRKAIFKGKDVFLVATMGLFSGDGAGCAARLLRKFDANIIGGLHIKMPDCIGDSKLLKKSLVEKRACIKRADALIEDTVEKIKLKNLWPNDGLKTIDHLAGLFGQRLYFSKKTKKYYRDINIDESKCIKCGLCASLCPTNNIIIEKHSHKFLNKCTMCYRCFSNCPKAAITILGKKVFEQYKCEDYID